MQSASADQATWLRGREYTIGSKDENSLCQDSSVAFWSPIMQQLAETSMVLTIDSRLPHLQKTKLAGKR